MRSIEEILRTYNIVNSRTTSRYTLRFAAAFLLAGVFVVAGAMLLTGGPDRATGPGGPVASQGEAEGSGASDGDADPFQIVTLDEEEATYIGYPLTGYDAAQKERYDREAVATAVVEWLAAHPTTAYETPYEKVYDPQGDGVLMGYRLQPATTSSLP